MRLQLLRKTDTRLRVPSVSRLARHPSAQLAPDTYFIVDVVCTYKYEHARRFRQTKIPFTRKDALLTFAYSLHSGY